VAGAPKRNLVRVADVIRHIRETARPAMTAIPDYERNPDEELTRAI
jgi:hypothetical protein